MHESRWGMTALVTILIILLVASAAWNGFLWGKIGSLQDSIGDVRDDVDSARVDMRDIEKRVNSHDRALRELGQAAEDIQSEQEGTPKVDELLRLLARIARILL